MDLGVELEFSDGTRVVDTAIAGVIRRATADEKGVPRTERYTYEAALALIGPQSEKDFLRRNGYTKAAILTEHLRRYGG